MNSNSLKVLNILEVEPPDLLSAALDDEFFNRIKMDRIPVLIMDSIGDFGGFCSHGDYTNQNEIVIDARYFRNLEEKHRKNRIETIRSIYLHECAHRITNQNHYGGFLALNILIHLRAGILNSIKVYDFHEEPHFEKVFEFAYLEAKELADTQLPAEECSVILLDKYNQWTVTMKSTPELELLRHEESEARRLARKKEAQATQNLISNLKQDRWLFSIGFSVLTFMISNYFLH